MRFYAFLICLTAVIRPAVPLAESSNTIIVLESNDVDRCQKTIEKLESIVVQVRQFPDYFRFSIPE